MPKQIYHPTHYPTNHAENKDISYFHLSTDECDIEVHFHDSYEVFQALSDNIRYYVEGKAYDVKKYDIIITNTKEIHRPSIIDETAYIRRYIQFKPHIFTSFFDTGYNPLRIFEKRVLGNGNLITIIGGENAPISQLFLELQELFHQLDPKKYILAKLKMIQLFLELEKQYHENDTAYSLETDSRILPLLKELNEFYDQPFSLDALSKKYFVDKYYISHLFKKNTGFTIYEYVQTKRIQKAKTLINKGIPISEASRLCGFEDYSNFYKAFKKLVQLSPSAYKKMMIHLSNP